jgi:hypothetical protein
MTNAGITPTTSNSSRQLLSCVGGTPSSAATPVCVAPGSASRATACSLYAGVNRRLVCFVISSLQVGIYFTAWSGIRQQRQQHHLAGLAPLALFDMDQHPVAVDVADLEVANLGRPEAAPAGDAAVFKPGPGAAISRSDTFSTLKTTGSFRGWVRNCMYRFISSRPQVMTTQRDDARVEQAAGSASAIERQQAEAAELAQLRRDNRDNRRLKEEVEVLRKGLSSLSGRRRHEREARLHRRPCAASRRPAHVPGARRRPQLVSRLAARGAAAGRARCQA